MFAMPPLANVRREKFAQGLAEGLSGAEAYRRAGYRGKGHSAEAASSQILRNLEVQQRVADLRGRTAERAEITRDTIIAELEEARQLALQLGQAGAAVQAAMGIAKVLGLVVDRAELSLITHKPSLVPTKELELSEEEWRRQFVPS